MERIGMDGEITVQADITCQQRCTSRNRSSAWSTAYPPTVEMSPEAGAASPSLRTTCCPFPR
eukprot:47252-Eustigmatos_ZCMA.PRE.1